MTEAIKAVRGNAFFDKPEWVLCPEGVDSALLLLKPAVPVGYLGLDFVDVGADGVERHKYRHLMRLEAGGGATLVVKLIDQADVRAGGLLGLQKRVRYQIKPEREEDVRAAWARFKRELADFAMAGGFSSFAKAFAADSQNGAYAAGAFRRAFDGLFVGDVLGREVWEIPRGYAKAGEAGTDAAVREAQEEMGTAVRVVGSLGQVCDNTGQSVHLVDLMAAVVDPSRTLPPDMTDPNEAILRVQYFTQAQADELEERGAFYDGFTLAALHRYTRAVARQPDVFPPLV